MRKWVSLLIQGFLLLSLLALTWAILVYHQGIFPAPHINTNQEPRVDAAHWIPKSKLGIHQLILKGSPYERGLEAGKHTQQLLYRQERELIGQYQSIIPFPVLRKVLEVLAIRWFLGIESYFEEWTTQEMYGVSQSASKEFDHLIDRFTRQIAYHGLHEVGQLAVDQGGEGMGCTVVAYPHETAKGKAWIIGRNFDFEGGRIFDSEKIMKWVFPDQGYAFVSVIWAGMVGAVTGVNQHGVYISLNAAGSKDFRRHGTPSTLVLLKALQFSKTADEAVEIIKKETMFITDIFVVSDPTTTHLFRVEKSPDSTEVLQMDEPSIVVNHLISPRWQNDGVNQYRATELTSHFRKQRGQELLKKLEGRHMSNTRQLELEVLGILRDKGEDRGHPLQLGNRRAIDALIATHAVVYNGIENLLYVSQGPGVSGPMVGFDLKASFEKQTPVVIRTLPRDPLVSDQLFTDIRTSAKILSQAERLIRAGKCDQGATLITGAKTMFSENYHYHSVLGDLKQCQGDLEGAQASWKTALSLSPAYLREIRALERKLHHE